MLTYPDPSLDFLQKSGNRESGIGNRESGIGVKIDLEGIQNDCLVIFIRGLLIF
ncbi:MAG: hypothetical protein F6K26_15015 [Moorea sp. SIO2I5]|nr:hypothetical protein [Moorena sp. SIO2I5]